MVRKFRGVLWLDGWISLDRWTDGQLDYDLAVKEVDDFRTHPHILDKHTTSSLL